MFASYLQGNPSTLDGILEYFWVKIINKEIFASSSKTAWFPHEYVFVCVMFNDFSDTCFAVAIYWARTCCYSQNDENKTKTTFFLHLRSIL